MKRISLKDVAREAGISTSAVSFILNGRAEEMRISKDLEKRVQAIASKLGYVPNQVAVSLRTGQSKMIGLVVESIAGHFFGLLAKIIEEEAEKAGYKLLYSSTENKAQRGIEILKMFSLHQPDIDGNKPYVFIPFGKQVLHSHHCSFIIIHRHVGNSLIRKIAID